MNPTLNWLWTVFITNSYLDPQNRDYNTSVRRGDTSGRRRRWFTPPRRPPWETVGGAAAAAEDGSRATGPPHHHRHTATGSAAATVRVCPPRGQRASRVFQVCVCLCTRARAAASVFTLSFVFDTEAPSGRASTARTTTRRGAPGGPHVRLIVSNQRYASSWIVTLRTNIPLHRQIFFFLVTFGFFFFFCRTVV